MRLLIYESAYRRLTGSISAIGGVEPVVMNAEGQLSLDGRPIELADAAVGAAWANNDAFFGPAARDFSVAMLKSADLKWLQSGAAGFDHPIFRQLVGRGVRLSTSHGQAVGMAEYVLAGVLDHFQNGPARRAAQQARDWNRQSFREVMGSHWLVIGFGAIGEGVAVRARAFGARITGVRRNPDPHHAADRIASLSDLPELLPEADVVVLACPLTPETRNLVDASFLGRMKPGSVLVNVGRGGLVDEPALLTALDRGVPAHALLDVFVTEPLPADSPFWSHPRVALSPHASGVTDGQSSRNDALFLENLARYRRGEPLISEIAPGDVLAED